MPSTTTENSSLREQTFEVLGFTNNPAAIIVKVHGGTAQVHIPDHQQVSGAFIALHDDREGEQAKVTFNGFTNGQIHYYDISYNVGGGGNITIEQIGAPATRKGDATFMQNCYTAWHKLAEDKKKALHNFFHLCSNGKMQGIEAPKENKELEAWVRAFAHGVYVGVGAWGDSPGNKEDNEQSKGTPGGTKNSLLEFND